MFKKMMSWTIGCLVVFGLIFSLSVYAQEDTSVEEGSDALVTEEAVSKDPEMASFEMEEVEPSVQQETGETIALPGTEAVPAVGAEAEVQAPEAEAGVPMMQAVPSPDASEKIPEWLWGEVVSVDREAKAIVIKHLDYDTYEETMTTLLANNETKLENVDSLDKIKVSNNVSVDYLTKEGLRVAQLIVVETEAEQGGFMAAPKELGEPQEVIIKPSVEEKVETMSEEQEAQVQEPAVVLPVAQAATPSVMATTELPVSIPAVVEEEVEAVTSASPYEAAKSEAKS